MMNPAAYRKLFWGFLFTVVQFRIAGFDLLPDAVGYILITVGLGQLSQLHSLFRRAHTLSFALLLFSPFSLWDGNEMNTAPYLFDPTHIIGMLIAQCYTMLSLLLSFFISRAIISVAEQSHNLYLVKLGTQRWNFLFYSTLASLYAYPFLLHAEKEWIIFIGVLGIISLIAKLVWIFFLSRTGKEYCEMESRG